MPENWLNRFMPEQEGETDTFRSELKSQYETAKSSLMEQGYTLDEATDIIIQDFEMGHDRVMLLIERWACIDCQEK